VPAAGDPEDGSWEGLQGLYRRTGVGRFGIVDVLDPTDFGDVLEAMGQAFEMDQCLARGLEVEIEGRKGEQCGDNILGLSHGSNATLAQTNDLLRSSAAYDCVLTVHPGTGLDRMSSAKLEALDIARQCKLAQPWIVSVQYGRIPDTLAGEYSRLCGEVTFEVDMAIEVIGRDVEQHGSARPEGLHTLELKRGDFEDRDIQAFTDEVECRNAEIARGAGA
jgi:hypothetical protein